MDPVDTTRIVLIHGLMGSSQGRKAKFLRGIFPGMLTPDFQGTVDERMQKLEEILDIETGWRIIGSSLGGLMGAKYTCAKPEKIEKLVLLAPALIWPDFSQNLPDPVSVPVVIYHGESDELIPLEEVRPIAGRIFSNLTFHSVEDNHSLHKTIEAIDWRSLIGS